VKNTFFELLHVLGSRVELLQWHNRSSVQSAIFAFNVFPLRSFFMEEI